MPDALVEARQYTGPDACTRAMSTFPLGATVSSGFRACIRRAGMTVAPTSGESWLRRNNARRSGSA